MLHVHSGVIEIWDGLGLGWMDVLVSKYILYKLEKIQNPYLTLQRIDDHFDISSQNKTRSHASY